MKLRTTLNSLAALSVGALWVAPAAMASTVTFDWVQTSGSIAATGSITLSSTLLTPQDASGAAQFNLTGTGSTAIAEVASFSFSFDGHTLSSIHANSTGWTDDFPGEPINILESTWSASQTFSGSPAGTLQVVGNSTQFSTASFGSATATGEWKLVPAPVPVPATAWLLVSAVGGLGVFARRRLVCQFGWTRPIESKHFGLS